VLISGRGSNLGALLAAREAGRLPIPLRVVLSDRADAAGLDLARRAGVPALHIPPGPHRTRLSPEAEEEYVRALRGHGVDLVALAGFMRVLHAEFLGAFDGRILNIHPSPAGVPASTHRARRCAGACGEPATPPISSPPGRRGPHRGAGRGAGA
jgi:phosphoribosylglycinamide formyltransferase-1